MEKRITVPDDIEVEVDGVYLSLEKGDKKVIKKLKHPLLLVKKEKDEIVIKAKKDNKTVRSVMQTFESKINNSINGLEKPFEYEMTLYYRHFPMDVKVKDDKIMVKNFLGEKKPREVDILEGVNVEKDDDKIYVRGADKEAAGQTAANIERGVQAPSKRDSRVFQDGIYITKKPER